METDTNTYEEDINTSTNSDIVQMKKIVFLGASISFIVFAIVIFSF